jgi:hypothetical protein
MALSLIRTRLVEETRAVNVRQQVSRSAAGFRKSQKQRSNAHERGVASSSSSVGCTIVKKLASRAPRATPTSSESKKSSVSPATLNPGKHFDSISTDRHGRKTRRTPSYYLSDRVRLKWGLLQNHSAYGSHFLSNSANEFMSMSALT